MRRKLQPDEENGQNPTVTRGGEGDVLGHPAGEAWHHADELVSTWQCCLPSSDLTHKLCLQVSNHMSLPRWGDDSSRLRGVHASLGASVPPPAPLGSFEFGPASLIQAGLPLALPPVTPNPAVSPNWGRPMDLMPLPQPGWAALLQSPVAAPWPCPPPLFVLVLEAGLCGWPSEMAASNSVG